MKVITLSLLGITRCLGSQTVDLQQLQSQAPDISMV